MKSQTAMGKVVTAIATSVVTLLLALSPVLADTELEEFLVLRCGHRKAPPG